MEIRKEIFDQQRRPRFGNANPERMQFAFWEWMIRSGDSHQAEEKSALSELGVIMRGGKLKSTYGPYRARDLFNVPLNREDGPIWTFDRMGATRTELPDGRLVYVGGEHEDSYDPDFCIYNDVVVFGPADQIEIFGYPKDLFPPTDFHTATLAGDRIIIVGGLGYPTSRCPRHTPVYALELSNYQFSAIETQGESPGWISHHEADFDPEGIITIRGGQIFDKIDDKEHYRRNVEDHALDLRSNRWRRLTNRNWHQFGIRTEDGHPFVLDSRPKPEALLPRSVEPAIMPCDDWNSARFVVEGVPVALTVDIMRIEVLFEGNLSEELASRITEEIRANAEYSVKRRCLLEKL